MDPSRGAVRIVLPEECINVTCVRLAGECANRITCDVCSRGVGPGSEDEISRVGTELSGPSEATSCLAQTDSGHGNDRNEDSHRAHRSQPCPPRIAYSVDVAPSWCAGGG